MLRKAHFLINAKKQARPKQVRRTKIQNSKIKAKPRRHLTKIRMEFTLENAEKLGRVQNDRFRHVYGYKLR